MKLLGIDFGSAFFKGAVVDRGKLLLTFYRREADSRKSLMEFLEEVARVFPEEEFKAGVCGSLQVEGPAVSVNEIIALGEGIRFLHPRAASVIEIGAQTSKFVVLGEDMVSEFSTNELCAAGTGSFIEQQAKRLKLSVEELSSLAFKARRAAKIAGRCSVFAKSDMIHLQQKGTPVEEIAYGLCMAIARNSWVSLLKGRDFPLPLVIAGGCAFNRGIIRAFSEVLSLEAPHQLIPSRKPGLEVAVGAALEAERKARAATLMEIREGLVKALERSAGGSLNFRRPLPRRSYSRKKEPRDSFYEEAEGYLGIDVGSVSTDFAVLDREGRVISSVYLPTKGRPVEVIMEGLSILRERFKGGLKVLGCGVTGSGRYLAAGLVGADVVKNEITCQALGAMHFFEDVDTIFEIGGQDSKYIYLKDGKIEDFTMNKICAAGTGSFLEEQAEQLGINIFREFANLAFSSKRPLALSSRCTVFMESEVAAAKRKGAPTEDICSGLAYAIAENYLERVVERRKVGKKIVFQGGVASNPAVVAAFEEILGREIEVHPYNRISGAIGAALAAKLYKKDETSSFKGFELKVDPRIRTFECKACPNYCEVSVIRIEGEKVFFGDACERFSSKKAGSQENLPNPAEEYIALCQEYFKEGKGFRGRIGIPRASSLMGFLPFWATFFSQLGFQPVLSPPSSEEILLRGVKALPVGACLPVKLTAGHVLWLLEKKVDYVFVPAVVTLPGDRPERAYGCPYTQSIPFMIKLSPENFVSPAIRMSGAEEFARGFEKYYRKLGTNRQEVLKAFTEAMKVQGEFELWLRERGRELLRSRARYKFAVLGRPYNLFDPYLNLNLFAHLRRLSVLAIPINYLPLRFEDVPSDLPWKFSSDILKAARKLREYKGVYPVIVSNFGCGPDAFVLKHLEEDLRDKPYLFLEFDEHRGEAGLITRLEAFLDRLEAGEKERRLFVKKKEEGPWQKLKGRKIYLPYFADHAYAFSGALKFAGYDAEVLHPPDEETRRLGEFYSSGKECHAYAELLGDLIKLSRKEKGKAVYFFPGTKIPCLLNQYGNGMRLLLKNQGIENIHVYTPYTEDFINLVGMEGAERFYKGVFSIDLLVKAACQVRPYEEKKGTTDRLHRENLLRIEGAIERGEITSVLKEGLKRLNRIKKREVSRRPLVGIAGDIYTRANPYANHDLFRYLEDKGLEVWPSPFEVDIIDFGISRAFMENLSSFNLAGTIISGGLLLKRAVEVWKIRRAISGKIERFREPGYREVLKLASPYMWNEENEILLLNIAKIVDFARGGADGVINAMCFNCMIGTASAAIVEKIKRDYQGLPIITLVYTGAEHPSLRTSLDAFIEQVKRRAEKKGSSTGPGIADGLPLFR